MIDWFLTLSDTNRVTLITGTLAFLANIAVVGIGFIVTYLTSSKAIRSSSQHALDINKQQIRAINAQKLAEFRVRWIEELRNSAANLYEQQYRLSVYLQRRKRIDSQDDVGRERSISEISEVSFLIAQIKRDIILRINPETNDENERKLKELLRKPLSSKKNDAKLHRKEIESTVNRILRQEWRRVTEDLGPSSN